MFVEKYLENRVLNPKPASHILLAESFLRFNGFPRKTKIIIEGLENIPLDKKVIFAMNHPNMYNGIPFFYQLYKEYKACPERGFPSMSVWAKAKLFHIPFLGTILKAINAIPVPSRGYVFSKDFQLATKRIPTNEEYRLLRNFTDRKISHSQFLQTASAALTHFATTPHLRFNPSQESYPDFVEREYNNLMQLVSEISEQTLLNNNTNLVIFPEGCVSPSLRQGQTGLAQIALKTGVPVVPVAANGLDQCYPDLVPYSRGGRAIYRVAKPISVMDDLAPFTINEDFEPFTQTTAHKFGTQFRKATDLIMQRINNLLDPLYQYSADAPPLERQGARRFV